MLQEGVLRQKIRRKKHLRAMKSCRWQDNSFIQKKNLCPPHLPHLLSPHSDTNVGNAACTALTKNNTRFSGHTGHSCCYSSAPSERISSCHHSPKPYCSLFSLSTPDTHPLPLSLRLRSCSYTPKAHNRCSPLHQTPFLLQDIPQLCCY